MFLGRVKPIEAILASAQKKSLHRSLGWFQLMLFGVGCVIGTGIFVLTAAGAQKAGPGLMLAFAIAGAICILAALCYAEVAAMIPVAGSAYTYTYSTMGEILAWSVGWALILEYAVAASAVSVGWSGYFSGTILNQIFGIQLPAFLAGAPLALGGIEGGIVNLPAVVIALLMTWLLMVGTTESAKFNAVLVVIKLTALTAFMVLTLPEMKTEHFNPFLPAGVFGGFGSGVGVLGAAATIFFAYVGFDAVSTAAEETKNPQRNVPIGLIGSLLFCTVVYILIAAGAIGASPSGGQPIMGPNGVPFPTGSEELARQCATYAADALPLVCSNEALAHVLRDIGWSGVGNMLGLAAFLALPSVILILIFGQTRIFFVMARDGLLPEGLSKVHPKWKTPYVVTMITGAAVAFAAAFLPVGKLADIANAGTLYAFTMVALSAMILRKTAPNVKRAFRAPGLFIIGPLTIFGCVFLFFNLPFEAMIVLPGWAAIGMVIYFLYGYRASHVGRGMIESHETEAVTEIEPHPPGTH